MSCLLFYKVLFLFVTQNNFRGWCLITYPSLMQEYAVFLHPVLSCSSKSMSIMFKWLQTEFIRTQLRHREQVHNLWKNFSQKSFLLSREMNILLCLSFISLKHPSFSGCKRADRESRQREQTETVMQKHCSCKRTPLFFLSLLLSLLDLVNRKDSVEGENRDMHSEQHVLDCSLFILTASFVVVEMKKVVKMRPEFLFLNVFVVRTLSLILLVSSGTRGLY